MQASPTWERQWVSKTPSTSSSALHLGTGLPRNLFQISLLQMPRGCPDVQAGSRVYRGWRRRSEWPECQRPFLFFEIRARSTDVM